MRVSGCLFFICYFSLSLFGHTTLASHPQSHNNFNNQTTVNMGNSTRQKRVLCGYGIDLDAVSAWANTGDGTSANPSDVSRGIYGATVGVDRLLSFLDKHHIKATWFVPTHSLHSFPKQVTKIRDGGHEMQVPSLSFFGLHGYTHEHMSALNATQEEDVLSRSFDELSKFLGKAPSGWTAPGWKPSSQTVQLLEKYGIKYDHSFMHHDSQMYRLPYAPTLKATDVTKSPSTWMQPMSKLHASSIVEIPANWQLDDWPAFNVGNGGNGFIDPDVIFKLWTEQFDFYYQEYDSFVFPITVHPQVSGKPHVLRMHERLVKHINSHEGVEWMTMDEMSDQYNSGQISGHVVEGGVDL
ncbi:unnamed protein product [Penicillium salamii]|uniref:NodB homology domain-containing protein n=1 Tax=Penicillium salamii TaxID=1612424 RepID=A0A9W4J1Y0_9EURO|nr:unnamed protein product [Penicillium salamii]CAG8315034.1 unnamed protein product [Penicillium salamii]CAG8342097.1 unnamed protein product [Penicillium salamii]CAG8364627.1 unnamed protein product [Penicillium salamii]CAG8374229.1 unnamed protein product [Penicillium salamii]